MPRKVALAVVAVVIGVAGCAASEPSLTASAAVPASAVVPSSTAVPPSIEVAPAAPLVVDVSADVPRRMTLAKVREVVLDEIARDTARARLAQAIPHPVPTRLLKITLLAPGQHYEFGNGGSSSQSGVSWAVAFQGISVSCGSTCTLSTEGTHIVDDASHMVTAGGSAGEPFPCPGC